MQLRFRMLRVSTTFIIKPRLVDCWFSIVFFSKKETLLLFIIDYFSQKSTPPPKKKNWHYSFIIHTKLVQFSLFKQKSVYFKALSFVPVITWNTVFSSWKIILAYSKQNKLCTPKLGKWLGKITSYFLNDYVISCFLQAIKWTRTPKT